jgi:Molybdopterin guanine dinucleotide synthesis protein B
MKPAQPVPDFAAYSGTGKTTLLRQLIPLLAQQGLRTGIIKHAHHEFDIDIPGKDCWAPASGPPHPGARGRQQLTARHAHQLPGRAVRPESMIAPTRSVEAANG